MSITLKHVSYTYAAGTAYETAALKDISFSVSDGEFVGIMGKTGCGKSTLIQLAAGLMTPTKGQVFLDEQDINAAGCERETLRRAVGIVFQYPEHQLFETTVGKDVAFGLKHSGLPKEQVLTQVQQAIELMGFHYDEIKNQSPLGLSGGEKRRIAIAGVLAAKPKILILDEPIAGLDPAGREDFLRLTDRLNSEGITILMISHNADALSEHARRILILENGCLIRDDTARAVFSDMTFLRERGLGTGQVRETAALLKAQGYPVPDDIIHYKELLPWLISIGKGECS